jgi:hypothetical protein
MEITPETQVSPERAEALRLYHEAGQDYLRLAQRKVNGLPVSLRSITQAAAVVQARAEKLRTVR